MSEELKKHLTDLLREIHNKAQAHPEYTGGTQGHETAVDEINILAVLGLNLLHKVK